ncbi:MAG TPA: arylamine N-acetyltransferase [Rhodopila sp.]|nr:arylamine N-acetyltransferase [Rhodopila sp.]
MPPHALDLDAYLNRIGGLPMPPAPSLPVLQAIVARHTATIPFENLDVVLGRPVRLDLDSIQAKLVARQRGGYCFEHNTLLHAALRRLGFDAAILMARVVMGADEDAERPRTHTLVRVTLPEGAWLADVGFGNLTPTAPLSLTTGEAQSTPHEVFRIRDRGCDRVLQANRDATWQPLYRFAMETTYPIDHVVANWFTSTCPGGLFTSNLVVAAPGPGCRNTLFNGRLTVRQVGDAPQTRMIQDASDLRATLRDRFNLVIDPDDAAPLYAAMRRFADNANPAMQIDG